MLLSSRESRRKSGELRKRGGAAEANLLRLRETPTVNGMSAGEISLKRTSGKGSGARERDITMAVEVVERGGTAGPGRLSGKAGTPINANQIESREYEAYSQINRIKAS